MRSTHHLDREILTQWARRQANFLLAFFLDDNNKFN